MASKNYMNSFANESKESIFLSKLAHSHKSFIQLIPRDINRSLEVYSKHSECKDCNLIYRVATYILSRWSSLPQTLPFKNHPACGLHLSIPCYLPVHPRQYIMPSKTFLCSNAKRLFGTSFNNACWHRWALIILGFCSQNPWRYRKLWVI